MMREKPQDLTRTVLAVLFIGGLIAASFYIIKPFLAGTVWAVTLVIATWPVLLRVQAALGGRRGRAVAVMTVGLLVIVVLPLGLAIRTIFGHSQQIIALVGSLQNFEMPPPPRWLADLPLVGDTIVGEWANLAATDVGDVVRQIGPYAGTITQWFVGAVGSLGELFIQLLLTIAIAAVLYSAGDRAGVWCQRFGHRLAGNRGEAAVRLAGQAVRGVALGVVVTAIAQSVIGGIGLAIAGVPQAAVLTAVMLMFCVAQIGPAPVLLPAVIWLFMAGHTVQGVVLTVVSVLALTLDNFLRPVLIRRGADLPLLLILVGVIGGLLSFGMVGLFLGPVVLAVTYTLLQAWIDEDVEAGV